MTLYHLYFYVPVDDAELVKTALFNKGAGIVGNYQHCAWQTAGQGQFLPLTGAKPAIGTVGKPETVAEVKVEMVCAADKIRDVIAELKRVHPYEEPAYGTWQLEQF